MREIEELIWNTVSNINQEINLLNHLIVCSKTNSDYIYMLHSIKHELSLVKLALRHNTLDAKKQKQR